MGEFVSTARISEQLQLGYRLISGITVVDVVGEVDVLTCGLLRDRLLLAVTDDARRSLVVNLADMSFIDSTGIGVLVGVWHRMQAAEGILVLAAPSRQARAVLDTTGLTSAFLVCDGEAQAVQACRQWAGGQVSGAPVIRTAPGRLLPSDFSPAHIEDLSLIRQTEGIRHHPRSVP